MNPSITNRIPVSVLFLQARMRRDFGAVEEIGAKLLAANSANPVVRRALARQSDELGEPGKAIAHWRVVRDSNPQDFEASYHVALALLKDGAELDSAIAQAAPDTSSAFRRHLHAVLEDKDYWSQKELNAALHSVAICGVSYCGSTLIDRVLGGLPGVASIGESHWLTKAKTVQGYGPIDFAAEEQAKVVACSICGPNCDVLDFSFRRHLAADHTRWFYKIAHQLRTNTLISADKNSPKLVDHDPLLRFDGLVVFKSPSQAWFSELKKRKAGESESHYLEACQKYIGVWTQSYKSFLEDFSPAGKTVFLSFEDFAKQPLAVLKSLTQSLSLPFDESVLTSILPGHAVGGNAQAIAKLRRTDYTPDIAPLEDPDLPAAHRQLIDASDEAGYIFERLQAAHRLTIPAQ